MLFDRCFFLFLRLDFEVLTADLFAIALKKGVLAVAAAVAAETAACWPSPILFDGCFFFFLRLDFEISTIDLFRIAL